MTTMIISMFACPIDYSVMVGVILCVCFFSTKTSIIIIDVLMYFFFSFTNSILEMSQWNCDQSVRFKHIKELKKN